MDGEEQRRIVVALSGGIGNQLFQYAFGRYLQRYHKGRLYFDLRHFIGNPKRKVKIQYLLRRFDPVVSLESFHPSTAHILHWTFPWHFPARVFTEWNWHDSGLDEITRDHNVLVRGYWQNWVVTSEIASGLRQDILLRGCVGSEYLRWKETISQETESVAIHFRRSDYVQSRYHQVLTRDYYRAACSFMMKRLSPKFFLFSDDKLWLRDEAAFFPRATPILDVPSDLDELSLMSQCKHFIVANSTYSWWGAWLGQKSESVTIAPADWGSSSSYVNENVVPPHWIRV